MRNRMISPPNLYGNMNETRILKNGAARHARQTKRYALQSNGGSLQKSGMQVQDGAASDKSPYFCVA